MSQLQRVLKAARGFDGVCQADFSGAETVDGGPIITRVAARLYDLEQQGHRFEHIGVRHRTKVFRLIEAEGSAGERRPVAFSGSGPAPTGQPQAGASAPLSPEVVEVDQKKPNTTNPEPLFVVGKAEFGYA